ncbi:MAG: septation regulator SpoVG [Erysipelotrichales bacterium]|nr:septation regulator SpoVG [Erysipelotrichales bacterium]
MKITDIRIKKVEDKNRLKAVVAITIDNSFVIHELRLIEGDKGLFLAMPSRKLADGSFRDIAHPINIETRELLEKLIIEAYQAL